MEVYMAISKIRQKMGEVAWIEHQKARKRRNAKKYQAANAEKYVNYRSTTKQKLIDYKGGKCERCGYDKVCPPAYDFHHPDPNKKDFSLSQKSLGFETAKKEVDKCMLVCRNCHAELEYEIWQATKAKTIRSLKRKIAEPKS